MGLGRPIRVLKSRLMRPVEACLPVAETVRGAVARV
jgi:hypothetical protein